MVPMKFLSSLKITISSVSSEFGKDEVRRMGATLAFYTVFSLAPLLVILIAVGGAVWGADAVEGQIFAELRGTIGEPGAEIVQSMIEHVYMSNGNIAASVASIFFLLLGASGVVSELRHSLNQILKNQQPTAQSSWFLYLKEKVFSIGFIFAIGFLLIVSLTLSAALSYFQAKAQAYLFAPILAGQVIEFGFSLSVIAFSFALLYKFLPSASPSFGICLRGGFLAGMLFTVGKVLIGIYLGKVAASSTYGAAGAVLIILLWVNYSSQIFLLGAEYLKVASGRVDAPAPQASGE